MRFLLGVAALVAASTAALATPPELGNTAPPKVAPSWPVNLPAGGRLDGDTVETAYVVPAIPFETTGTTTGFTDDYDEVCLYSGSTAPDVVYEFVVASEAYLDIDMCGSQYDTKIYVYDSDLNLVACNDDTYFGTPCGLYVSKIASLHVEPAQAYFLVVDGYGTTHGAYALEIGPAQAEDDIECPLESGPWARSEGEPPLADGYLDTFNSGCDHGGTYPPMNEIELSFMSEQYGLLACSGWYTTADVNYRDTDWVLFVDTDHVGYLTLEIESELPVYVAQMWPQDCDAAVPISYTLVEPCTTITLQTTEYGWGFAWYTWIWVAPTTFLPPAGFTGNEFRYSIKVLDYEHVAAVPTPPSADYTLGCPVLPPGETAWQTNDLSAFTNQFDPSFNAGDCPATEGRDMVWEVYLEQGDDFSAQIRHDWLPQGVAEPATLPPYPVFVIDDGRLGPESCITSSYHITGWTGLSFYAPATGWYYLVWDGEGASGVSDHMHVRNNGGSIPPPAPPHDTCDGAIFLPGGDFSLADDLGNARNSFDPGREGCSGPGGTGRDVVYRVAMQTGETLAVTMTGTGDWEEELYLVADCADPLHTCVAGSAPDGFGGMHLTFTSFAPATYWLVCDSYGNGPRAFALTGTLGSVTDVPPATGDLVLEPCRPNPFNPQTVIAFSLPAAAPCRLAVYGLDGRRVRSLVEEPREAGRHEVVWDGRDDAGSRVPSGLYFARLEFGGEVRLEKLALVK